MNKLIILAGPLTLALAVCAALFWLGPMAEDGLREAEHMRKVQRDAEAHARAQIAFDQRMRAKCGGDDGDYRHRAKNEYQCLSKHGRVIHTVKD